MPGEREAPSSSSISPGPAFYRAIVEAAPTATVVVDPEGTIVLVNARTEQLFGYRRAELVGRSVEVLLPERFRGGHMARRLEYMANPRARRMGAGGELYGLRRDDTEFPLEIGLNPVRSKGRMLVMAAIVDISERKQAEQRFRLAVESSPSAMVMVDSGGRIMLVNRKVEDLFGYRREELMGQPVELLVPERFRPQHPDWVRGFMAEPSTRPMGTGRDLFGRRKDGTDIPIEIGLNPIQTDHGWLVLSAIVDLTERKRAEAKLQTVAAELARSNVDLERFAAVASHDLKEPLRNVRLFLQLLESRHGGELQAQGREFLERAIHGSGRMHDLIDSLLAYSRVQSGDAPVEEVDLGAAVREAWSNLSAAVEESRAELCVEALPKVRGDPRQLQQLLQNLLSNAIKFRAERSPRVHVRAGAAGELVEVRVQDDGIGIAPQHAHEIFGLFKRLHGRSRYPGSGLGLSIAKRIVERHGGTIGIEPTPGGGTTFAFTLQRWS